MVNVPVHVPMFGLTDRQERAVVMVYHDGRTPGEVAELLGCDCRSVKFLLARACEKLESQGLPRPQHYGRGSRREIRQIVPGMA